MSVKIIKGDCLDELKKLADASIDSCVTDPPYHLTTGKKGGTGPASVNLESPYGRARVTTGFMGMTWDGGDVAHNPALWAEVLRVLKPGAYLLAFGGTRTFHRLAVAIEDAGWEIRDTVMWVYGSGFPKSHNGPWGGTALKPAWEPIILARKPLIGTVAANVQQYGTGGLNISACRVAVDVDADASQLRTMQRGQRTEDTSGQEWGLSKNGGDVPQVVRADGRWPANLIHDGSEEVLACFPESSITGKRSDRSKNATVEGTNWLSDNHKSIEHIDTGSAARFFYCAKASREDRNEGLQGMQTKPLNWSSGDQSPGTFQSPNTDRQNENYHPTVKPTALMQYLCRLVTPQGGVILDPFMGSGSTGKAAMREGFSFVGIEIDERYIEIAKRRIHADAPLFAEVES